MVNLDVLIVGAGTAGEYATGYAIGNGRSVGMVERGPVGGACIFNACIPTKALVHAARTYTKMRHADFFGLPVLAEAAQYAKVKSFKDSIVAGIATGRDERWIKQGVQVFKGSARFVSPHGIVVGDQEITASKIIISTGSSPAGPPIPGLKESGFITNVEAMQMERLPERLVIIGGGAVGVEFAHVFATFGASVYIVEMLDRLLATEDADISAAATEALRRKGVSVLTSAKVSGVTTASSSKIVNLVRADGTPEDVECDEILVAAGRRPNIEDLHLPAAGVEATKRGITVDGSLQTSVPHIWAAGDVTGTHLFTYVAGEQGKTAALNATTDVRRELEYQVLPRSIFCEPEGASVGLTESQAREQGYEVRSGTFKYADLTRAIVSGETEGFIKVVADGTSGLILGGNIIGSEASTLIHEIAVAMAARATAADVGNLLHSYPTYSEGVRYACQAVR